MLTETHSENRKEGGLEALLHQSRHRLVDSHFTFGGHITDDSQRGTLATLPVELFILVCLALDSPKDVLALASTCKAARAKFLENNVILRHVRPSFNPEPTLFIRSSTSPRVELSLWTAAILERKFPENSAFDNCTHCSSTSRTFPKQPSIMPWPLSTVGNFTKCRLSFNKQLLHSWVSQHFDLPAQKGVYTSSNDPTNSKFMQEVNYSRTPTRKLSNIENRRIINVVGFALNLLTKLFRFVSVTTPTGTPRYESIVDYTKLFNLTLKDSIWIAVVLRMSLSSEKQQAGLTAGQFQMCDCGKQLKGEFFGLFGKEFLDAISLVVDIRLAALYRTDFLSNRTQLMSGNSTIIPEGLRHVFWDENQEYLKSRMTIIESILDSPGGSSYEFGRLTSRLKLQNNGELPAGFVKDLNTCVRKEMPIVDLEFKAVRVSKDGFVNMEKGLGEDDVSPDGKWALFRVSDLWALKAKVYQLTRPPVS